MNNKIKNMVNICIYVAVLITLINLFDRAWILESDHDFKVGYKYFKQADYSQRVNLLSTIKR